MTASQPPGSPHPPTPHRRNRAQMLLIAALTLLPLILAWGLFHTSFVRDYFDHTNHGQLIVPPKLLPSFDLRDLDGKSLPQAAFTHHWSLVYIGGDDCDKTCVKKAFMIHNIRWLLQEHYKQLRVFYLAPSAPAMKRAQQSMLGARVLLEKAGDLPVMVTDGATGGDARAFFRRQAGSVVMIDPKGRWIMAYPPGFVVGNVYKDLKHLLSYSQL